MKKVAEKLQGKKTYVVVFIAVVFNTLVQLGILDFGDVEFINTILAALGFATLRNGMK